MLREADAGDEVLEVGPGPCPPEGWLAGYLRYTAMARYWHAAPAQTYTWKTSW